MNLFLKKPIDTQQKSNLNRCLTSFDLTLMGIGVIIGAGIFVLTGIAAATKAGPAVIFSYLLAGTACGFTALSYAELAASIGGCGSAYNYAYVGFGELFAWVIGWDLLLEYSASCSTVAIGWSGYAHNMLQTMGIHLPAYLLISPFEGGLINLPAVIIVFIIMSLLIVGVRESVRFNTMMVFVKLAAVAIFIGIASSHFNMANWHPFFPFGYLGIVKGAGLIFFAYIGFDALSTAADEAIHPQRSLPIGIVSSLLICTAIYIIVSGLLTGIVPYTTLNVSSPVAAALIALGYRIGAALVAIGAIAGLSTVILVMYYGLTRILWSMSADGLLPAFFSVIQPVRKTPMKAILIAGVVMMITAGFFPIHRIAEIVNIGTLAAFTVVSGGVLYLRRQYPELIRPFKVPLSPYLPFLSILFCVYLMIYLARLTWIIFAVWTLIGLVFYFTYGCKRSILRGL
jgi:basic amino acid/polyamine antiporter, APA family